MPFVSEAQRKWMWANKPKMARRWQRHTPKGSRLPARRAASLSSHDDVSRTYAGSGYQMFQKWMQGHPTLKGTPVIRVGDESVRIDMPSRFAADEQGRSLFWHAVDNLARRTGVTREMQGPNRVKVPVNRFDEHDKDLLGRRYGKSDNETYRGRTIMRVYAPDDQVAKALEKELQSEDFDVRVSGHPHDPDKSKTRQSMVPQAKKPVIMLLVQVNTDQEYKRLNAIMSKWGLGKLGPGHARTIMSHAMALPVPTDPHRRESFGIHIHILFQHPNAHENFLTSMSKLGHQDHFRLESFGNRRAVLHATMPSRLGNVPGHTHQNFVDFLKTLVQDAGGSVTKVTDSTVANSMSSVDSFVSAKPDPSPFLDARRKALLRKRLNGGEAPGQGISGPQGPPAAMSRLLNGQVVKIQHGDDVQYMSVGHLSRLVKGRSPEKVPIARLLKTSIQTSPTSGFSKRRMEKVDTSYPVIIDENDDLLDGRHRLMKLKSQGATHVMAHRVSKEDVAKASRSPEQVRRFMNRKRLCFAMDFTGEGQLTKRELSRRIAQQLDIPATRVVPVVAKALDHIALELMAGKRVELRNFGVFEMRLAKRKKSVLPNGNIQYSPERWYVHFQPSKRIHDARPGFPGKFKDADEEAPFSMAQEAPVTPVTTPPMRQKVSVDFPDEKRARAYAQALLRDVPGANVHVNSTRVRVDHEDKDGEKVHGIAAQHSKLARRASRRAVYLRRRQVQMAIDAAKAKTPEQAQPYQGPVPNVSQQQARTPDASSAPSRQRLYFEGYDLAQEAADWYSKHGVQVKHRKGDQIMVVHGPRKTVNEGIKRYKGSPMQVRCSESELRVEMTFPSKKLATQAMHWLTLTKIRNSWLGGSRVAALVPQSKWDHVYEQLNDIKFGPPKMTVVAEPGRGAPGGIPKGSPANPEETQHQQDRYHRAKGAGNKFLQYVVDFGSIVIVEKAKQALQRQGIDVEQEGSVLGVGLRAVAEAALTKVVEAFRGKVLNKGTGGNGHAPNPHAWVHEKYDRAPLKPPPVSAKDIPKPKRNTVQNRKRYGEPSSVPGYSFGLISSLIGKASIAVAAPLAKAAIKHLKDMGAKIMATKVVVTPGTVGKVIIIFEGTRQIIKDARTLLAPDAPRGAASLAQPEYKKPYPIWSAVLSVAFDDKDRARSYAGEVKTRLRVSVNTTTKTFEGAYTVNVYNFKSKEDVQKARALAKGMGGEAAPVEFERAQVDRRRKEGGTKYSFAIDQVAVAYAVMDFISSEATRMIADYLAQKGIELVTKGSKHLVAKVKEADWAGLQAKVKEAHGRLKKMRSNKVDAASFFLPAVPPAIVWGVYIIEGIAGALTAAVAVKELQRQGLAAKETERGVIVKGPEEKVEKVARRVRGRVRKLKKVPAASMGVGTMLKDPVFYKMLFFFGSAAAQATFMLWVQARAVKAIAVGSHYVWVQFRSDIMEDVRAAVKKFDGVFKKRAKEKPEASLALSPDEINNEKAAHIAGHQKQIEKLREKIKEARARGDHATANGHAERLQKHQDTLDVLTGKGGQQRRGYSPFEKKPGGGYTYKGPDPAAQARYDAYFKQKARANKINMWISIGIWGAVLAPYLIAAGINVVQKGKEWYAKVTSPKEKEQVEEAVKKARKQKVTSHAAV